MRLVLAVLAVLVIIGLGVGSLDLVDPGGQSEVVLLLSAGVTLWVAGVLARHGVSHTAPEGAGAAAAPAPALMRPLTSAAPADNDNLPQATSEQVGKPGTSAAA